MTFSDAIKVCFRKYAIFSGRATRSECWWFVLFLLLAGAVSRMIDNAVYGDDLIETHVIDELTYATVKTTGPFQSIFWLLTVLPFLAAGWRRMHDSGRSGLLFLYPLLVLVGLFTIAMLTGSFGALMPGSDGTPPFQGPEAIIVSLMMAVMALTPLIFLWWLTRPSQPGPNSYGPNPHEVTP